MQFLSRSRLQLQNRTCKPGAIFSAICRRDIAGVSNVFETWCNFGATKIASSCRDKNRLCKRALISRIFPKIDVYCLYLFLLASFASLAFKAETHDATSRCDETLVRFGNETNCCSLIGWFKFCGSDLSQMRTHAATVCLRLFSRCDMYEFKLSLNSCDRSQRQNSVAATMISTCHTRR